MSWSLRHGLCSMSLIPEFRQRLRSSGVTLAVSARIGGHGTLWCRASSRMRRVASNPSITGMERSIRMQQICGWPELKSSSMTSTAILPSCASRTVKCSRSIPFTTLMLSILSSASRISGKPSALRVSRGEDVLGRLSFEEFFSREYHTYSVDPPLLASLISSGALVSPASDMIPSAVCWRTNAGRDLLCDRGVTDGELRRLTGAVADSGRPCSPVVLFARAGNRQTLPSPMSSVNPLVLPSSSGAQHALSPHLSPLLSPPLPPAATLDRSSPSPSSSPISVSVPSSSQVPDSQVPDSLVPAATARPFGLAAPPAPAAPLPDPPERSSNKNLRLICRQSGNLCELPSSVCSEATRRIVCVPSARAWLTGWLVALGAAVCLLDDDSVRADESTSSASKIFSRSPIRTGTTSQLSPESAFALGDEPAAAPRCDGEW
eukprot:comp22710_c0_seq1/m.57792 comp22710_c0_seq1/g.57792  ORF comp22710_c0_seq1/g.57792 comp22710_c0_seq1/m.57792 type:complete len:434 (+) comp22710_c0_seq1:214-1515(+)